MRPILGNALAAAVLLVHTSVAPFPAIAARAQTTTAQSCLEVRPDSLALAIAQVDLVVVGTVHRSNGLIRLQPEAFLKGAATSAEIQLVEPADAAGSCTSAPLDDGTRVLAFLRGGAQQAEWPSSGQVFLLKEGRAINSGGSYLESELISQVRSVTNRYAVPATSPSEGQGIDWGKTVLPLSVALGVVFIIGLLLMRVWHRIDPT